MSDNKIENPGFLPVVDVSHEEFSAAKKNEGHTGSSVRNIDTGEIHYRFNESPNYLKEAKGGFTPTQRLKDAVSKAGSSRGELSKAATNAFWGFNHRNVGAQVKPNSDNHGLTFFTRPRLNLSYDNISGVRTFAPLLTGDPRTLPRAIRCILDPVSHRGIDKPEITPLSCPMVDPDNAFIPLLSNLLTSMSGWPDSVMDTHTSPNGLANESWSMVDSLPMDYTTNDLTINLRNMSGDPISLLMHVWTQYASRVSEGSMLPWPEAIAENEKDYDTRIYRLVLDHRRKYITKIAAIGYGAPYVNPLGAAFNFDMTQPTIQDNQEISIPFKCSGFIYNDPILVIEFNSLVAEYLPHMANGNREGTMVKLKDEEKDFFNSNGYPRISEDGLMELEWWVKKGEYDEAAATLKEFNPSKYIR
jgi:hypothetical protein